MCTGTTGHAEVVEITFNPQIVQLEDIFNIFWTVHDPTTLNRQSYDVGTEYRSLILYSDANQKKTAETSRADAQSLWKEPIVTEIAPLDHFYEAEDYQNDYETSRPDYCQIIINPKLGKVRKKFSHLLT